jgi:zinc transport system substrate-binding protein
MELFLQRAIANAGPGMKEKIITLSDGLSSELLPLSTEPNAKTRGNGQFDPHIWLDPMLAIHCVTNLCAALQKADPANSAVYAANARNYTTRLEALNKQISADLAGVKNRAFVTYHSAFRYFARRYGLNLAGVVETTPEVAPSARQLHDLLSIIREKSVVALFAEPYSSPRLARQIASDAGIRSAELDPLETGALEPRAYETGMRRNTKILVENLR